MNTIEEKAKAYDEVFRTAQELYNNPASSQIGKDWICAIFPELKESEGERIRKWIIGVLSTYEHDRDLRDAAIAWLKKQGGQKPADKVKPKFHEEDWIVNDVCLPIQIASVESDMYVFNDGSAISISFVDKNYHLWTIKDANKGDILVCPKYAGDTIPNIFIFKEITIKDNDVYCYCSFSKGFRTEGYIANVDSINTDFYPATKEQCDILLQKMKEAGYEWNKPADKAELKFHVGDWIVHTGTENIYQIVSIIDDKYQLKYGDNYAIEKCTDVDRCSRLWAIQDAKKGDVLAAHECLVLFKEIDGLNIRCYCTYHFMNNPSFYIDTLQNKDAFHPATKEQREQLEIAMADAGYTFDFEKKEIQQLKTFIKK